MTKRNDEQRSEVIRAIRRADAFTNSATVLLDAVQKVGILPEDEDADRRVPESYPEVWEDIHAHVVPLLEAEAERATEEVRRLRG